MNKLWKTCPNCSFLNYDRTHCIECDSDLRKVKPEEFGDAPEAQPCLWKLDSYNGCFDTHCDNAYCIDEAVPGHGSYRFCPGCGRRIKLEVRVEPL